MRTRAKGTSRAAVLAAGFVALGVTALPSNAFADVTSGAGGVLSGDRIGVPISAPVGGLASALRHDGDGGYHRYDRTTPHTPVTRPAVPAGAVGPVKRVAAEQAIAPADEAGATWTFGAAAVLAFAAGILGLTRRIRLGRR